MKTIKLFLMIFLCFSLLFTGLNIAKAGITYQFQSANEGLYGANITCLEIDLNYPNTIYAGTQNQGIFISIDSGTTWQWTGSDFKIGVSGMSGGYAKIFSIKSVSGKPGLLYAGTSGGLYKSENGGNSWINILSFTTVGNVYYVFVDPTDTNKILLGTDFGVFRSNNGGISFFAVNKDISILQVYFIVKDVTQTASYYIGTSNGLYKTIDDCETWLGLPGIGHMPVYFLVQKPKTPSVVFVGTSSGVFRSFDNCNTFGKLKDVPTAYQIYIDKIDDSKILAISKSGVYISSDNGENWSSFVSSSVFINTSVLPTTSFNFNLLYLGTNMGFMVVKDGNIYPSNKNLGLISIDAMGYDANYNDIYANSNLGFFRLNGDQWTFISDSILYAYPKAFAFDQENPGVVYTITKYGLRRSNDYGKSWIDLTYPFVGDLISICFDAKVPTTLYIGTTTNLYVSMDSGNKFKIWNISTIDFPIVMIYSTKDAVYILTRTSIYKSTDRISFNKISDVKSLDPTTFAVDPIDQNKIYLGTSNNIYISYDEGKSYMIKGDLPNGTNVTGIIPLSNGTVYIGTDKGAYKSISINDFDPPSIRIISPQNGSIVSSNYVTVSGSVSDDLSGVYKVFVNDIEATVQANGSFSVNINLVEGANKITVKAIDRANNVSTVVLDVKYVRQIILTLFVGSSTLTVSDGRKISLDSPPVIIENRTLVPIRAVIEALGGVVDWDATTKKVTIKLGETTLELWVNKNTATVNGVACLIDPSNPKVVPQIISGRTMLPVRFVVESLGAKVDWDSAAKKILITYPKP